MGRSYGDVALNADGDLCQTVLADNVLAFDRLSGRIRAESGITLGDLNKITIPHGWIIPVNPGTQFVTLGGAVANDVHGKNHHKVGAFGAHVRAFQIVRSNGETLICRPHENANLFAATISGLGLTGFIEWVEVQLQRITSRNLYVENIRVKNLDHFFSLSKDSGDWTYTAAWVDCFSAASSLGAGIFTRANFVDDGVLIGKIGQRSYSLPIELPSIVLNKLTISTFNWLYKRRPGASFKGVQDYQSLFYPLDQIRDWNKVYGRRGFYQHQSIIPMEASRSGVEALLSNVRKSGQGSFLAVLKRHGPETSPGLNSFALDGVSLALDFPNRGAKTRELFGELDAIVMAHGGRLYPAKDALMSAATYQSGYPNWRRLETLRDPKISSSFWRRVTQQE
jgi:FAD/FMN-containing dehydrogenase